VRGHQADADQLITWSHAGRNHGVDEDPLFLEPLAPFSAAVAEFPAS
jgi:hypothetical protein